MPITLDAMIEKGRRKLAGKLSEMVEDYVAAKEKAIAHYEALPFGPRTKAKYRKAWEYMPENYRAKMTPEIVDKWAENFKAGVSK